MPRTMIIGPRGGISVDDGGAAAAGTVPVVLVHGATGAASHWLPVAERLRSDRRVLVPELPGHGISDPPRDVDWTPEAMAEALHLVLEERRVGRCVLVGHSLAGNVVAEYATSHPERVAALCFVDTGRWVVTAADLDELRRGLRPEAYEAFTRAHYEQLLAHARPATRELVMRGLRSMHRENFLALMYSGLGYDMRGGAERFPGPKLALCAEAFGMAARWSGSDVEVQTMPGVSHWLQLDAPDEVARTLHGWVARVV